VVLDEDGRSNFAKLAHGRTGTHYYGFDLLVLGDADLRARPLEARKAILADLLHGSSGAVRYCDHGVGRGKAFFDTVREAGLEGIAIATMQAVHQPQASLLKGQVAAFPKAPPLRLK
jgi:bifunctional non-homologous end joining protein LigD